LEKLPPDIITLNPDEIGTVLENQTDIEKERENAQFDKDFPGKEWSPKFKARGRTTSSTVHGKKQQSAMNRKKEEFEMERIQREEEEKIKKQKEKELPPAPVNALNRFKK